MHNSKRTNAMIIEADFLAIIGNHFLIVTLNLIIPSTSPQINLQQKVLLPFENSTSVKYFILRLVSQNRNLTITEQNGYLFANSQLITSLRFNMSNCLNDVSLRISINDQRKTILSPSLCHRNAQLRLQLDDADYSQRWPFYGCIENVISAGKVLLDQWCSSASRIQQNHSLQRDSNTQSDGPRPPPIYADSTHFAEPLILHEGTSAVLQQRNFMQKKQKIITKWKSTIEINFRKLYT
ncbi:unnamed protein product, partial [Thelazia callipaeda]|uniref:Laminin G domain-containing protein n=1 Tax=Thelazia callipaeda TaxID=103827 RepID=A0A0N5CNP3_THECL